MFNDISKHLNGRQKQSSARRIFNSLLDVWKCGQARSFAFDIISWCIWISVLYSWTRHALICSHNLTWYYISFLISHLLAPEERSLSSRTLRKRKRSSETISEGSGQASGSLSVHEDVGEPVMKSKRCLLNIDADTAASTSKATTAPAILSEGTEATAIETADNDVSVLNSAAKGHFTIGHY